MAKKQRSNRQRQAKEAHVLPQAEVFEQHLLTSRVFTPSTDFSVVDILRHQDYTVLQDLAKWAIVCVSKATGAQMWEDELAFRFLSQRAAAKSHLQSAADLLWPVSKSDAVANAKAQSSDALNPMVSADGLQRSQFRKLTHLAMMGPGEMYKWNADIAKLTLSQIGNLAFSLAFALCFRVIDHVKWNPHVLLSENSGVNVSSVTEDETRAAANRGHIVVIVGIARLIVLLEEMYTFSCPRVPLPNDQSALEAMVQAIAVAASKSSCKTPEPATSLLPDDSLDHPGGGSVPSSHPALRTRRESRATCEGTPSMLSQQPRTGFSTSADGVCTWSTITTSAIPAPQRPAAEAQTRTHMHMHTASQPPSPGQPLSTELHTIIVCAVILLLLYIVTHIVEILTFVFRGLVCLGALYILLTSEPPSEPVGLGMITLRMAERRRNRVG